MRQHRRFSPAQRGAARWRIQSLCFLLHIAPITFISALEHSPLFHFFSLVYVTILYYSSHSHIPFRHLLLLPLPLATHPSPSSSSPSPSSQAHLLILPISTLPPPPLAITIRARVISRPAWVNFLSQMWTVPSSVDLLQCYCLSHPVQSNSRMLLEQ